MKKRIALFFVLILLPLTAGAASFNPYRISQSSRPFTTLKIL